MKQRTLLSLILLFFFTIPAFPASIKIIDKFYRTLVVLPFKNKTGNQAFDYLGKSLQTFISTDLDTLNTILISSNDITKPKIKTNYIISSNLDRTLVVINSLTNIPLKLKPGSIASNLSVDYLLYGQYTEYKKEKWDFQVSLYSRIQNKIVCRYNFYKSQKQILDSIPELTLPVKKFFSHNSGRNITISSEPDFAAVFNKKDFLGYTPLTIFISGTENIFTLKKYGYLTVTTNLSAEDSQDNSVLFIHLQTNRPDKRLIVKTIPSAAKVYIDENFIGFSPVTFFPLEQNFILSISKSNYKNIVRNISLKENKKIILQMQKTNTQKKLLTNTTWSWIMFGLASACMGYGVYNGMQSEYYKRLQSVAYNSSYAVQEEKYYNYFAYSMLSSIPFWGGVLYFNIRNNNEKDW